MTMDFNASSEDFTASPQPQSEMPFAGVPSWDRGKTRARSTGGAARRTGGSASSGMKNSTAPIAIVAGIVVLGAVAAAGWYATQPHNQSVAELTPGGPNGAAETAPTPPVDTAANAPASTSTSTTQVAQATPSTKTVTHTTRVASAPQGQRVVTHSRTVTRSPSASDATAD
ncbi:MAG: hypothetical protein JSR98_15850, partial [Proteobacteria bacterium]|nr:hypothetical protein [Pseudomonadota bacterium]